MERILIVDDDSGFRKLLETILRGEGYSISIAGSVQEAKRIAASLQFDLILTDLRLPGEDGLALLRWSKEHSPETPVIMITAFSTVASAVEAMKQGAADYLGKPLGSPDELRMLVRRILDQRQMGTHFEVLREQEETRFQCSDMIAGDGAMRRVLEMVRRVAPTNATVLITGESGTGKELIARCIHSNSTRAGKVFVPVNCAALSPTLIESELFGHEKGAFTGATGQHSGRFERAQGGTLFLDEIGELDANLQAKLLRVLQDKSFERVGGTRQINADVRLIAATNRNLQQSVTENRFREDLFYRLNGFPVELPPLRNRQGDIPQLARHFLNRSAHSLGKPAPTLSAEAEAVLRVYDWPGNIRELENTMERLVILCDDVIEPDDLPMTSTGLVRPVLFKEIERQAIEDATRRTTAIARGRRNNWESACVRSNTG